jgi:hypothetical protein
VQTSNAGLVRYLRRIEAGFGVCALFLWSGLPFPPDAATRVPSVFLGTVALAGFVLAYAWRRPVRGVWWAAVLLAAGVLLRLAGGVLLAVVRQQTFTLPTRPTEQYSLLFVSLFYGSQVVVGALLYSMRHVRHDRYPPQDRLQSAVP